MQLHVALPTSQTIVDRDCDGEGDSWFDPQLDCFNVNPSPNWSVQGTLLHPKWSEATDYLAVSIPLDATFSTSLPLSVAVHIPSDVSCTASTIKMETYLYGEHVDLFPEFFSFDPWKPGILLKPGDLWHSSVDVAQQSWTHAFCDTGACPISLDGTTSTTYECLAACGMTTYACVSSGWE
jgi:hypothetical protein